MPCFIVCLDNFGCFLAIHDGFGKIDILMLDLLIFEVKVPFAQHQIALTQLVGILDFIIINHFLQH